MKYIATSVIALTIGFSFLGFQYWWYLPGYLPDTPKPIVYAWYWPKGIDFAITTRTSECGIVDGVYYFKDLEHPTGWTFISLQNLHYGRCLDNEVPADPIEIPSDSMRFN